MREIYSENGLWIWIFSPFTVQALPLPPKMWMPLKSLHQHWGKPPGPDLSAGRLSFGVVALTGYNGTNFLVMYELMGAFFVMCKKDDKCFILPFKNIQIS